MRARGWLVAALLALGCGGRSEPVISCDPVGAARPLCGFHNPEDLVALPGGTSLLVSEYGGLSGEHPGAIARLDLASETRRRPSPRDEFTYSDRPSGESASPLAKTTSVPGTGWNPAPRLQRIA